MKSVKMFRNLKGDKKRFVIDFDFRTDSYIRVFNHSHFQPTLLNRKFQDNDYSVIDNTIAFKEAPIGNITVEVVTNPTEFSEIITLPVLDRIRYAIEVLEDKLNIAKSLGSVIKNTAKSVADLILYFSTRAQQALEYYTAVHDLYIALSIEPNEVLAIKDNIDIIKGNAQLSKDSVIINDNNTTVITTAVTSLEALNSTKLIATKNSNDEVIEIFYLVYYANATNRTNTREMGVNYDNVILMSQIGNWDYYITRDEQFFDTYLQDFKDAIVYNNLKLPALTTYDAEYEQHYLDFEQYKLDIQGYLSTISDLSLLIPDIEYTINTGRTDLNSRFNPNNTNNVLINGQISLIHYGTTKFGFKFNSLGYIQNLGLQTTYDNVVALSTYYKDPYDTLIDTTYPVGTMQYHIGSDRMNVIVNRVDHLGVTQKEVASMIVLELSNYYNYGIIPYINPPIVINPPNREVPIINYYCYYLDAIGLDRYNTVQDVSFGFGTSYNFPSTGYVGIHLTGFKALSTNLYTNGKNTIYFSKNKNGNERLIFGYGNYACSYTTNCNILTSLGYTSQRYANFYVAGAISQTSDIREKTCINNLTDTEKRVGLKLKSILKKYKFKNNLNKIVFGAIAQEVVEIFASEGLDAHNYGLLCYDEWESEEERLLEAGNKYGIRYEELIALIIGSI